MTRNAFTLLETLLVVLILALLAGAAALKLGVVLQNATTRDVVERLVDLDLKVRQDALRRGQSIRLICSLGSNVIHRVDPNGQETPVLHLPGDWRIRRLIWAERDIDHGQVELKYSLLGYSESVVWILERDDGQRQVLLITGWTGQAIACANETDAKHLVQLAIEPPGHDPD